MVPLLPVFQQWYRASDLLGLLTDDASQETGMLSWCVDAVEPGPSDCLFDSINEVVESVRNGQPLGPGFAQ